MAARSPFPRRSLRSLPPSPSRASPPAGKAYPRAGEGGALSAAAALRLRTAQPAPLRRHRRALSWGAPPPCPRKPPAGGWARRWRASPHPTRQRRQSHKRAGMRRAPRAASAAPLVCASRPAQSSRPRLRAVPRRAPLAHQAACAAAASVASPRAAAGSLSRGPRATFAAFSGCIVGPGVAARLSPAQLAGPAGFPLLLHFPALQLANICSMWYNICAPSARSCF